MRSPDYSKVIEINDRFHDSALLQCAITVGLFDYLSEPRAAQTVAEKYGWRETKTSLFLNALTALDLVDKKENTFNSTEASMALLSRNSERSLAPVVENQRKQWDMWGNIEEFLAIEGPHPQNQSVRLPKDEVANDNYNAAMRNLSVGNIIAFLEMDIVKDGDRVLDLAGGHGIYLSEILEKYPATSGEVWELPAAADFARAVLNDPAYADRSSVVEQDIADTDAIRRTNADLVLLNNCLHYFDAETARGIVEASVAALNPGGRVVITAVDLDEQGTSPEPAAMFALNMMMNSSGGGLHTTVSLIDFLEGCGIKASIAPGGSLGVMGVNVIWGTKE